MSPEKKRNNNALSTGAQNSIIMTSEIYNEIAGINARQLELKAIMTASDEHATKCAKLGLKFKTEYPEDYAAYIAARQEYNDNEKRLADLKEQSETAETDIIEPIEQ